MTRIYDVEVDLTVYQTLTMEVEADNETEAKGFVIADIERHKSRLKDIADVHTLDVNLIEITAITDKTDKVNEALGITEEK